MLDCHFLANYLKQFDLIFWIRTFDKNVTSGKITFYFEHKYQQNIPATVWNGNEPWNKGVFEHYWSFYGSREHKQASIARTVFCIFRRDSATDTSYPTAVKNLEIVRTMTGQIDVTGEKNNKTPAKHGTFTKCPESLYIICLCRHRSPTCNCSL